MSHLKLKIVTPERVVYEAIVDSVTLPTGAGEITVLKDHIPLVATLQAGEIRTKVGSKEHLLAVSTGFVEVRPGNEVVLLADTAELADELDIKKIEEARELAKKTMADTRHIDQEQFALATAALERELARYKVASKRKR
ncbi:MAG: ATP synthase F1 subunit epsilon [Patescibacteria group bacterium]